MKKNVENSVNQQSISYADAQIWKILLIYGIFTQLPSAGTLFLFSFAFHSPLCFANNKLKASMENASFTKNRRQLVRGISYGINSFCKVRLCERNLVGGSRIPVAEMENRFMCYVLSGNSFFERYRTRTSSFLALWLHYRERNYANWILDHVICWKLVWWF